MSPGGFGAGAGEMEGDAPWGCSAFPSECWLVVFFWVLIYLVGWGGRMYTGWFKKKQMVILYSWECLRETQDLFCCLVSVGVWGK